MITSHRPHQHPHVNPYLVIVLLGLVTIVIFGVLTFAKAPVTTLGEREVVADVPKLAAFPAIPGDAFPEYRLSERTLIAVPVASEDGAAIYQLSERTLIPANAGLETYHLSERTMIPADAGLIQYHESERTQVVYPIDPNDPLYQYRLSEWFGK